MVASLNICSSNDTGVDTSGSVGEKKKTKKLVIIEWLDIISDDGWATADECQLPTFYTVGWLEHQDEKVTKISNTLDFDDFTEEKKKQMKPIGYAITCFPSGCVTNIIEIKSSLGSPFV